MDTKEIEQYVENLNLQNDEQRIQFLDKISDEYYNFLIIRSFESDELKLQYLDKLKRENYKAGVIHRLSNEADKIKCIDKLTDEKMIADTASMLTSIEDKVKYIQKIKDVTLKAYIVKSLQDSDENKINIIKQINDENTKSLIIATLSNDEDKIQFLQQMHSDSNRANIIITLTSDEKKIEYLEQMKEDTAKTLIIASLKDKSKKNRFLDALDLKYCSLQLPQNMTIGMEIECEGKNSANIDIIKEPIEGWTSKLDNSLIEGVEVVSPILTNTEENIKNIYRICNVLNGVGQAVSSRCGAHIHVGADYLKSVDAYINFLEIWGNNEKIIYEISNSIDSIPRDIAFEYAEPLSKKIWQAIKNKEIDIYPNITTKEFIEQLKKIQDTRKHGLNLLNIDDEKNTIEFRLSNGTLEPNIWIENANLFGGMIEISQRISEINKKDKSNLTKEENIILKTFTKMKDNNLKNEEKLDLLLNLCVPTELKNTFKKRYERNHQLLNENVEIKEQLENKTTDKPLIFRVNDIGKTCFTGDKSVTHDEMIHAQTRVNEDMQQMRVGRVEQETRNV